MIEHPIIKTSHWW